MSLRSLLFAAIICGFAAGAFAFLAQEVSQIPLILEAETYENTGAPASSETISDDTEAWGPADGFERKSFAFMINVVVGIGYSLLLIGAYSLWNRESNWLTGLYWGLAGYVTFMLAPSLGLAPEIPGVIAAELFDRQVWWVGTVVATGIGLGLIFLVRHLPAVLIGIALLAMPHIIGAPHPEVSGGLAPQQLAEQYVVATLVTGLFFWMFLGALSGHLFRRFSQT